MGNILVPDNIFERRTLFKPLKISWKNRGFDGSGEHKSTNNFYEIIKVNDNYDIKIPKKCEKKSIFYENLLKFEYFKYNIKNYFLFTT